jgi:Peroxiredoxin
VKKIRYAALFLLAAIVSAAAGYYLFQSQLKTESAFTISGGQKNSNGSSLVGAPRPDFNLQGMDGKRHGPEEWSGKIVILNFWASWCPPCLEEIPGFIRLQDRYAGQGVQFVGIALQQADEVREFVRSKGMNYPVLVGVTEVIRVAEDYGNRIGVLPYTVIIDRAQHIAFIKRGPLPEHDAERLISSLLSGAL